MHFVDRHLTPVLEELAGDLRVLVVNGPRQSGKTTLLRQLHGRTGGGFFTLDQAEVLRFAKTDPAGFVADAAAPTYIDEVQRAGDELIRAIKIMVDEDPRPGRFVLSGSSRFLTIPTLSESLVGRAAVLELWPLSVAELAGAQPGFVEQLFADHSSFRARPASSLTRLDYLKLACAGGFPELLRAKSARARSNWFRSYLTTLVQRDVRDIAQVRFAAEIPRMLSLLAGRTAQTVKITELAQVLGMDPDTVRSYLPLMEQVYLIHWLPAWSNNFTARATRSPKLHFVDTGLASRLMNRNAQGLAQPGVAEAGALFESFIVSELRKELAVSSELFHMLHYRDRDGAEIDCVIETADRRIACIEIKLAMSVNEADFRHLRTMRDRQGDRFACGVVFYCGRHPVPFGDRMLALPASTLWSGLPVPDFV